MVGALALTVLSSPAVSSQNTGNGAGKYTKAEIEKMDQAVKSGKTVSLGKNGEWSVSGTGGMDPGAMLARFERLPGGKAATKVGHRIISIYREYLEKLEAFVRNLGI